MQTGGAPIGSVQGHRDHRQRPGRDHAQDQGQVRARCPSARARRSASSRSRASPTATSTSAIPDTKQGRRSRTAVDDRHRQDPRPPSTWTSSSTRSTRRRARRSRASSRARRASSRAPATQANEAFQLPEPGAVHLQPPLQASSRATSPTLEHFLVDSSRAGDHPRRAPRRPLRPDRQPNDTTRALGNQKLALAESIQRLPPFMRRANTTFVNLRAALDDVDPLVDASKPVARALGAVPDPGPRVRRRRQADGARPARSRSAEAGRRQRPDRPRELRAAAGRHRAWTARAATASDPPRRVPRDRRRLQGRRADHRRGAPVHHRLPRLARRLLHHRRRLRRDRRLRARQPQLRREPQRARRGQSQYRRCPGAAEEPAPDGSNVTPPGRRPSRSTAIPSERATGNVP